MNFTDCLERLAVPHELLVPAAVVSELLKLQKKGQKHSKVALKIIEKFVHIVNIPCNDLSVDDCILSTAEELKCSVIATTDSELKMRAIKKGFRVMYIRGKSRYEISD